MFVFFYALSLLISWFFRAPCCHWHKIRNWSAWKAPSWNIINWLSQLNQIIIVPIWLKKNDPHFLWSKSWRLRSFVDLEISSQVWCAWVCSSTWDTAIRSRSPRELFTFNVLRSRLKIIIIIIVIISSKNQTVVFQSFKVAMVAMAEARRVHVRARKSGEVRRIPDVDYDGRCIGFRNDRWMKVPLVENDSPISTISLGHQVVSNLQKHFGCLGLTGSLVFEIDQFWSHCVLSSFAAGFWFTCFSPSKKKSGRIQM